MTSTRDFKAPGQFAADATTTIPGSPTLGVAYRDTSTTEQDSEDGWAYGTRVDSATFNQILWQLSGLMRILDNQGVLGWSDQVDYVVGAITIGSDGLPYRAIAVSGPGSTVRDPVVGSSSVAWERYGARPATGAEVQNGATPVAFVTPSTLLQSFLQESIATDSGQVLIPIRVGTARFNLIVKWGGGSAGNGASVSFPTPFPTACFRVIGSDSNGREVFGTQGRSATGFTLRTSAGGALQFDYLAIGW